MQVRWSDNGTDVSTLRIFCILTSCNRTVRKMCLLLHNYYNTQNKYSSVSGGHFKVLFTVWTHLLLAYFLTHTIYKEKFISLFKIFAVMQNCFCIISALFLGQKKPSLVFQMLLMPFVVIKIHSAPATFTPVINPLFLYTLLFWVTFFLSSSLCFFISSLSRILLFFAYFLTSHTSALRTLAGSC